MASTKIDSKQLVNDKTESKNKKPDPYVRNLLSQVFTGMDGRYTRLKIVMLLKQGPHNTNQLAEKLGLSYKTIQHNIGILEKNNLIDRIGGKYGSVFYLSTILEYNLGMIDDVLKKQETKFGSKKIYL